MPKLTITFVHLALIENRPDGARVVLPHDQHEPVLVTPAGTPYKLDPGSEVSLFRDGRLFSGATVRASSEYVVHLDHVFKRRVSLRTIPSTAVTVNLNGGKLLGRAPSKYPELGYTRWRFVMNNTETPDDHVQKLTDTFTYEIDLSPGAYHLAFNRGQAPIGDGAADINLTIRNNDSCDHVGAEGRLDEFLKLYALTDAAGPFPIPTATLMGFNPLASFSSNAREAAASRRSCDAVCGDCQIG